MNGLRVFIVLAIFIFTVLALVANAINAIKNDSIQSAFFAGVFFWIIIDYAFKAMVIDKLESSNETTTR